MSKQSDATKAAREAKREAEQVERMASTYRQFAFACKGGCPVGDYYDLPQHQQEDWRRDAIDAARTLGLKS